MMLRDGGRAGRGLGYCWMDDDDDDDVVVVIVVDDECAPTFDGTKTEPEPFPWSSDIVIDGRGSGQGENWV